MTLPTNSITVLILTWNEDPNIGRVLERLRWAKRVIVLDSFSSDQTAAVARAFENVEVIERAFDSHAEQCNFGLSQIETEWTLILDADYLCPDKLADEAEAIEPNNDGYECGFQYACYGRTLRGTLYPPRTILFRTKKASFVQDGHTQRVVVDGSIGRLRSVIVHDDRKPLSRWVQSQSRYASLEADKLALKSASGIGWKDRLRTFPLIAPILTLFYCLIWKGLVLDGRAGLFYTAQRVFAELLLSIELLDRRLRGSADTADRQTRKDDT